MKPSPRLHGPISGVAAIEAAANDLVVEAIAAVAGKWVSQQSLTIKTGGFISETSGFFLTWAMETGQCRMQGVPVKPSISISGGPSLDRDEPVCPEDRLWSKKERNP